MGDCTNPTWSPGPSATASTAGVLHPHELAQHLELTRSGAGEAVSPWVENHWALDWGLPPGSWFESQVLPHPACSLTVELTSHPRPDLPAGHTVVVTGVTTKRFDVDVAGSGRIRGVRFRPGGLAALTGRSAAAWTDRVVPASEILPEELCLALAAPALAASAGDWAAAAERGLLGLAGAAMRDDRYEWLLRIVADMLADRSLLTVAQVAERHGATPRTLQRLFNHYVGIGPKWVLARYRMHDLVEEIDDGYTGTITELAHRYGWYDQAHLTRDFTALVGVTPGQYRAR